MVGAPQEVPLTGMGQHRQRQERTFLLAGKPREPTVSAQYDYFFRRFLPLALRLARRF